MRLVQELIYGITEGHRIGRRHRQPGHPVWRHKRDARVELCVYYRLAACHCLQLHNAEGFASHYRRKNKNIRSMMVGTNVVYLAQEGHAVADFELQGQLPELFAQWPLADY